MVKCLNELEKVRDYSRSLSLPPFTLASDQTPDYQLKVKVAGLIGEGDARLVSNDSLSILEQHSVGLEITRIKHFPFSL